MSAPVTPTPIGVPAAATSGPVAPAATLRKAAQQFEAVFIRQMIGAMRTPSLGDDLFGSDASKQFRDMADARLADSMAGRFGIATLLEKQLGDVK